MDDLISRADTVEVLKRVSGVGNRALEAVRQIPSARPTGEWILGNGNGECPYCHHERQDGWDNFCGYCGADMRGGDTE